MEKTVKACAWVISPINAIQCLIAHQALQNEVKESIDLVIYNYYPTENDVFAKDVYKTVEKIVHAYDETISCTFIDHSFVNSINGFNYILYAHDVVGNFLDHLTKENPLAKRVCYGDALGQLFKKDVHLGFLVKKNPLKFFSNLFSKRDVSAGPDYAILTIPVAQSRIERKTQLVVPQHALAISVFEKCRSGLPLIENYLKNLTKGQDNNRTFLFMTENIAEGNFMTIEQEMSFYTKVISENCPPGSSIIVKPHPGEQIDRIRHFEEQLSQNYDFIKFDPSLKRYPIELFYDLLKNCTVISMFYPSLSLKYLYNMDVIQPMTDAVIEKYFASNLWASYKNAIELNMLPLSRLKNWDKKSLLYNGG